MDELLMRMKRGLRRERIAYFVFAAAIGALYITNFVMRTFVYGDNVLELLWDFAIPLVIASCVFAVKWRTNYSLTLLHTFIPQIKMLAILVPLVAVLASFFTFASDKDSIDFNITVFAMTSMCITPYVLRNVPRTCIAIVIQTVVFILLAANLGNNTAAIVTIICIALVLICYLKKLTWINGKEEYVIAKVIVALIILWTVSLLLIVIPTTGVARAFYISSLGRPGLGSSAIVNQQCASMLASASFVGSTPIDYPADNIFANRVVTYILAQGGWLAAAPILLALMLVITSGIYLCRKSISIQYYISISCLTVITVQIVGYLLMCAGWDVLLFPELCPFLDGGCYANTIFLLMAVCILPQRPMKLGDDTLDGNDDDEDDDEWLVANGIHFDGQTCDVSASLDEHEA